MSLTRTKPMSRGTGLRRMSAAREQELREAGTFPFTTFRPNAEWTTRNRKPAAPRLGVTKPANEFPAAAVQIALEREHWSCASCGRGVGSGRGMFWSAQHRRARQGLWLPDTNGIADCLILCGSGVTLCHGRVEQRGEKDRHRGYWIRQFTDGRPADPTTVPVLHAAHGWVLLDNDGGYERCDEPEEAT